LTHYLIFDGLAAAQRLREKLREKVATKISRAVFTFLGAVETCGMQPGCVGKTSGRRIRKRAGSAHRNQLFPGDYPDERLKSGELRPEDFRKAKADQDTDPDVDDFGVDVKGGVKKP
jgi:hypothetical protein